MTTMSGVHLHFFRFDATGFAGINRIFLFETAIAMFDSVQVDVGRLRVFWVEASLYQTSY